MVAAEKRQSRLGLVAVAKAFAALGEDKVASMALSRIGKNWVEETNDSAISFHLAVGTSKRETVVENNVQSQDTSAGDQWTCFRCGYRLAWVLVRGKTSVELSSRRSKAR